MSTPNNDPTPKKRKWYLLISNTSKSNHLGTLLRCAAAFHVHQVLLVGQEKFNNKGSFGSHKHLDYGVFSTWEDAIEYLKRGAPDDDDNRENGGKSNQDENVPGAGVPTTVAAIKDDTSHVKIKIIGILGGYGGGEELYSPDGMKVYEHNDTGFVSLSPFPEDGNKSHAGTTDDSKTNCSFQDGGDENIAANQSSSHENESQQSPLHTQSTPQYFLPHNSFPIHIRPFSGDTCFILSKDKRGLPISQARMCDGFVHVPHLSLDPDSTGISQSNLLDTAMTFSIIHHHYTAWAGYTERMFMENQKFLVDQQPCGGVRGGITRKHDRSKKKSGDDGEDDDDDAMMEAMLKDWGDFFGS